MLEMGQHPDWNNVANNTSKGSAISSARSTDTIRSAQSVHGDIQKLYGGLGEPTYDYLLKWNQDLDLELQLADEDRGRCRAELHDLTRDVSQLCNAWSKVCAAAGVDCNAVNNFHFLVTDAEVDSNSRAAAHWELEFNKLCCWIIRLKAAVKNLSLQNSGIETGGTVAHWTNVALRLSGGDSEDDMYMEQDLVDWQLLYEKERRRFEALKERHKTFKTEAERMYQPDLEHKHQECQAELIKAQDRVAILESAVENAKQEALAWRQEVMQAKNVLNLHEVKFNEHRRRTTRT